MALAVSCAVVWFVLKRPAERDHAIVLALALAMGALPWMHHKFLLYAAGLFLLVAYKRWSLVTGLSRWSQGLAVAFLVLPQMALHLSTLRDWGTLAGGLAANAVSRKSGRSQAQVRPKSGVGSRFGPRGGLWPARVGHRSTWKTMGKRCPVCQ